MYNKLCGKLNFRHKKNIFNFFSYFPGNGIQFKKKVSSVYPASTATGTPVNTYSCAATVSSCTPAYTSTTSTTTVVGCCATDDNCFALNAAAPTWTGLLCNTGVGSAVTTVGCPNGACKVNHFKNKPFFSFQIKIEFKRLSPA
jgi:hypothetical protein